MDRYCRICRNTLCNNHGKNISFLGEGWQCDYIPVPTNADRIRAMSDEELAASVYIPCPYDDGGYGECKYGWHKREQSCEECKLEWLQQPAKE